MQKINSNFLRACGYLLLFVVTMFIWNNRHSYGLSPAHAGGMLGVWVAIIGLPLLYVPWVFVTTLVKTKKLVEAVKECKQFTINYIEVFFPKKKGKRK